MDLLSQSDFRLAVGCDHAGYDLKISILEYLESQEFFFDDFGTFSRERVDYPNIAIKVASSVAKKEHTAGILICGTGIGMSIAANKLRGIRAALCTTKMMAEHSRSHNNANILCMGGWVLSPQKAIPLVKLWLTTPFEGGRHERRLNIIEAIH